MYEVTVFLEKNLATVVQLNISTDTVTSVCHLTCIMLFMISSPTWISSPNGKELGVWGTKAAALFVLVQVPFSNGKSKHFSLFVGCMCHLPDIEEMSSIMLI